MCLVLSEETATALKLLGVQRTDQLSIRHASIKGLSD